MNIKLLSPYLLSLLIISGCAVTGEAEDKWDEEEKEAKISLGNILGTSKQQKENETLKERIEQLERATTGNNSSSNTPTQTNASINQLPPSTVNQSAGGITPPSLNRPATPNSTTSTAANNSVSYQEWLQAKNSNSDDYKKFKEYQEWLEFQRAQQNR